MMIETENAEHHAAVRALNLAAFPSPMEADLVDALRGDGDAVLSLVALDEGQVIGHVMFSAMQAPFRAAGLAPVAVAGGHRCRGVAAALIEKGVAMLKADGWEGVFVLGDPDYYGRFGFSAAAAAPFTSPYAGPYLMLLALSDGPFDAGRIDYAPAFARLG